MTPRRSMTIALALAALTAGYTAWSAQPPRPGPVIAARTSDVPPVARRYRARELLAAGLDLSIAQRNALEQLAADWETESATLDASVQAASAEFEDFMVQAKERGGASLADIQAGSADLREVSGTLRERRNAHGAAALAVLSPRQRHVLARAVTTTEGGVR